MAHEFSGPGVDALRHHIGDAALASATFLGDGWHVRAYRAGDWVVRLPRSESGRGAIERQTRLYQTLGVYQPLGGASGVVPRDARIVPGIDGKTFAGLYRFIDGRPGEATAALASAVGQVLSALHRVPIDAVRHTCTVVEDLWSDRFEPRLALCRPHLTDSQRHWVEARVERFLSQDGSTGSSLALAHGDLCSAHLLVDDRGTLTGVIDFSGPRIADPALDVGTLIEQFGAAFAEAAMRSYDGDVDDGFLRRAAFYADVRPLVTIALGLRGDAARLAAGVRRLDARIAASP